MENKKFDEEGGESGGRQVDGAANTATADDDDRPPPTFEHLEELLEQVKAIGISWQLLPRDAVESHPDVAKAYERMLLKLIVDGPDMMKQARQNARASPTKCTPSEGSGAACWICLEEGPDESGQGIFRDCSCRGNTAGFAHLSCLVQFAQSKSKALCEKSDKAGQCFPGHEQGPFEFCSNCKQNFLGELGLDMAKECLKMYEDRPEIDHRRLQSKVLLARRYGLLNPGGDTMIQILEEIASTINEAKKAKSYPVHLDRIEADINFFRGQRCATVEGPERDRAKRLLSASRNFYERLGDKRTTSFIEAAMSDLGICDNKMTEADARSYLERELAANGKDQTQTIVASFTLVRVLLSKKKLSAAYECLTDTASTAVRVMGPNNPTWIEIQDTLYKFRGRHHRAALLTPGDSAEEKKIVLAALSDDGTMYHGGCDGCSSMFSPSDIVLGENTPVVCVGLFKSHHLNGKAATVEGYDKEKGRHVIAFEDDELGQAKVKGTNLRAVFFN